MLDWKQLVRQHLAPLRLSPEREIEIVEEVALHFEAAYDAALADGLSAAAAEARALESYDWRRLEIELRRVESASIANWLPAAPEQRGRVRMETFLQDVRYGLRLLRKHLGFTLLAVLTLALGIGACTAIFSVVYAVLLRPLPFAEQERLMVIWKKDTTAGNDFVELALAEVKDWQQQAQSFESLAAMPTTPYGYGYVLTGRGEAVQLESSKVTGHFFSQLGVPPALGRTLNESDDQVNGAKVVVLSDRVWRERFNADPHIIGQSITLTEASYTVVGVMPAKFVFPKGVDIWLPFSATVSARTTTSRGASFLQAVGKLKPGIRREQAEAELNTIIARLATQYPETQAAGQRAVITPLGHHLWGDARPALWLLLAATAMLLLIAAANIANLLLARATARRREFAVRAALGAGRWRLVRQLLSESLVLALSGGVVGVVFANWLIKLLLLVAPEDIPRIEEVQLNFTVLLFSLGITLLTALIFGVLPALTAAKLNLNETLSEGGNKMSGERTGIRTRSALVVAEVAVTVVLLASATLILRSFVNLSRVKLGFDPHNVLTMQLRLQGEKYSKPEAKRAFYQQLIERLEARPEVEAASAVLIRPLEGPVGWDTPFTLEGQSEAEAKKNRVPNFEAVTPHYLRTFKIPLKAGREFTDFDTDQSQRVVIISETMAKTLFGADVNPLGKRLQLNLHDESPRTIVGVVADMRYRELQDIRFDLYIPYAQWQPAFVNHFAVRTSTDPNAFNATVRREVATIDPTQAVTSLTTMEQRLTQNLAQPRFSALLLNWLSGLALLLAALGIYGVLAYSVAQRTGELGIRLALGAQARDIVRLVIGQGMKAVLIGVGIGLAASFVLTRSLKALLFGVTATDPLTFVMIALLLVTVALLACWLPARRATKVDPMTVLRSE